MEQSLFFSCFSLSCASNAATRSAVKDLRSYAVLDQNKRRTTMACPTGIPNHGQDFPRARHSHLPHYEITSEITVSQTLHIPSVISWTVLKSCFRRSYMRNALSILCIQHQFGLSNELRILVRAPNEAQVLNQCLLLPVLHLQLIVDDLTVPSASRSHALHASWTKRALAARTSDWILAIRFEV